MPRLRHVRPALLALSVAVAGALAAHALGGDQAGPVGVDEAAAALPGTLATPRIEAWAPRPDPDGARGETNGARPPSAAALTGYVWPLPGARLTLPFAPSRWGSRIVEGALFHDGVDMATFCGDRIYAAHEGVVLAAGRRFDRFMGWQGDLQPYFDRLDEKQAWLSLPIVVVIDDGNDYRSIYAHFRKVVVEPGQHVRAGELIGFEGDTGRASGCHLHYGLFSPRETAVFEIEPSVAAKLLVPRFQTARIDPLLVLPDPPEPPGPPMWPRPAERPPTVVPSPPVETVGR